MKLFCIGLDLGQAQDYSALAVAETVPTWLEEFADFNQATRVPGKPVYHVRHLQRWQLGTSYPVIVKDVAALSASARLSPPAPALVVDQTGVGRPVVDMLRAAQLAPVPVTITTGSSVSGDERGGFGVPKRDLVSTLQVLLQAGRLKFAEGLPEVPALVRELLAFQVKITPAANDTYGSWREGSHDDLVLAVALAVWFLERGIGHQTVVTSYLQRGGGPIGPVGPAGTRRGGWGKR